MTKKQAILRTATRLFAEKGYKDTSMAELARATGVAQGTIFYHFSNKSELFISILDDFKKGVVEEFENYIKEKKFESGLKMVEKSLDFYLYLAGSMEDQFLILHRHDAYELAETNPVCRDNLEAIYDCLVDIFERAIVLGQKDGSIRDVTARKAALIIFGMVDGVVRFDTYRLYDAAVLYSELLESSLRILKNN